MIGSYIEAVCGINNIKISGSQQLATDIGYGRDAGDEGRYLSNVISAFGLGNASVLGVFKEVFALTDSGSKRKAVMKTRAVSEVEHRGNHFRRRGPHSPESGETARSAGVLMCFLEQTGDILIHNSENSSPQTAYQMELAEEAILGHRSAASLATGPVIPDPFISPLGFTITPALSISHSTPPPITLEVQEHAVLASPALSLSHHDGGHDYEVTSLRGGFLPFLRSSGFPFFTEAMNMSPGPSPSRSKRKERTASRESVETSTPASDRNHVQILGTRVISAVNHSADGETEAHSELVSSSTSTT